MSAVFFFHGFPDIAWFIGSAWVCLIISGLLVMVWEGIISIRNKRWAARKTWKEDLFEFAENKINWMSKEIADFESSYEISLLLEENERARDKLRFEFKIAIGELKQANSRFKKSLTFATIVTLLVYLFDGGLEGIATCIMLLFCPHLIALIVEKRSLDKPMPMSSIKNKSDRRNRFTDSVTAIFISIVVAGAILNWGTFENEGAGPFN